MKKSDVIRHFGSQTAAADALGISQAAISKWGETIPELQAVRLEQVTNKALRYDPDLYRKPTAA